MAVVELLGAVVVGVVLPGEVLPGVVVPRAVPLTGGFLTVNGVPPAKSAASVWDTGPTMPGSLVVRPSSRLWARPAFEKFWDPTNAVRSSTTMALAWMYRAPGTSG